MGTERPGVQTEVLLDCAACVLGAKQRLNKSECRPTWRLRVIQARRKLCGLEAEAECEK